MSPAKSKSALSRLHDLHAYSLPQFLAYSRSYIAAGDGHLFEEVQEIAVEQERMACRLADVILSSRERLPRTTFPARFASLHDLELRHLIKLAVEEQRTRLAEIEVAIEDLSHDAMLERI